MSLLLNVKSIFIGIYRNLVFLNLLTLSFSINAQQWEWVHRNFRLNYWIDPASIQSSDENKMVDIQSEGMCSYARPEPEKIAIKRWVRREEINCEKNISRSRNIKIYGTDGQLISSEELNGPFKSPPTLGYAKIISRICNNALNYENLVDDTKFSNFTKFSDECLKFADKRVDTAPDSRLIAEAYVDLSRIFTDAGITYAWTRYVTEVKQTTKNGKDYFRTEVKYAFRCNTRESSNIEELKFDAEGKIVDQFKVSSVYSANWQSVRPGTVHDKLSELVCKKALSNEAMSKPSPVLVPTPPSRTGTIMSGTGSGFRISSGNFITNNHVVEGCARLSVQGNEAKIISADKQTDLALLKANGVAGPIAQIRKNKVRVGDDISVAGFPLNGILSGFNFTRGNISSLSGLGGDTRLVQISAPVQPGNSGGPLLDSDGNVVGVVVSKLSWRALSITGDIPQNVNFAINSNSLISFLDANSVDYQAVFSGNNKSVNFADVAEKGRGFTVLIECYK